MIVHDLTDTIPWIDGVKPKCRKVIGQFGNAFVLPKYCGITKTTISRILYGVFEFKYVAKEKVDKHPDIRVYYTRDIEVEAYSKFIDKLRESGIFLSVSASKVKQPYGEVTRKLFKLYDLPVVIGVSASMTNGKFRQLHTRFNSANVFTTCVTDSRDVVIQKIKEHLAKLPAEWRDKRHIPEIYLEKNV